MNPRWGGLRLRARVRAARNSGPANGFAADPGQTFPFPDKSPEPVGPDGAKNNLANTPSRRADREKERTKSWGKIISCSLCLPEKCADGILTCDDRNHVIGILAIWEFFIHHQMLKFAFPHPSSLFLPKFRPDGFHPPPVHPQVPITQP